MELRMKYLGFRVILVFRIATKAWFCYDSAALHCTYGIRLTTTSAFMTQNSPATNQWNDGHLHRFTSFIFNL